MLGMKRHELYRKFQKDLIVWKPILHDHTDIQRVWVSEGLNSVETLWVKL